MILFLWAVCLFLSYFAVVLCVSHTYGFARWSERYFAAPPPGSEARHADLDVLLHQVVLGDPDAPSAHDGWATAATIVFCAPYPVRYARELLAELARRDLLERFVGTEEAPWGRPGRPAAVIRPTYGGLRRADAWLPMARELGPPDPEPSLSPSGLDLIRLAPPGALKDGLLLGMAISSIPLGGATLITLLL